MRVYDKLIVGLRAYTSVRLLTQILSWCGTIYVVRHLGSHAIGQYAVALVVFSFLAMTFDGSLLETLVQRPPSEEERRGVFTLVVGIGLILASLAAGLSGMVARLVGDPAVTPLVIGAAGAFALMSVGVLPQATLARQMAFPRLASIAAAQSLFVTITTVILASLGVGAQALMWGLIVGAFTRVVFLNIVNPGFAWPTLRIGSVLGYVRFGGLLFADNLLWRWYTSLDTFLLGRWAGTTSLGYYNLAQQVAELPLEKITTVVNDVSLPAYAELRAQAGGVAQLLLETIRTHAIVGFALFWGLGAVASYAIPVLFGNHWQPAIFPLVALSTIAPWRLIGSSETPAMTGIGRPEVLIKTKLIIAPCMTLALLVACRFWGIRGAALAWAIAFPICHGISFRYVLRAAQVPYKQVLLVVRGPAGAAALMVGIVLVWERMLGVMSAPPIVVLISAIGAGAVSYALGLQWIDPEAFHLVRIRFGRFIGVGRST